MRRAFRKVVSARIPSMVVTLGSRGAVYADMNGDKGVYPRAGSRCATPPARATRSARVLR